MMIDPIPIVNTNTHILLENIQKNLQVKVITKFGASIVMENGMKGRKIANIHIKMEANKSHISIAKGGTYGSS